jgi:hypothetical protein
MTRKVLATVMALGLIVAWTATPAMAQDPPPPEQEKKDEEKKTYAGKWNMSMQSPNGAFAATVEIILDKEDPKKISGTIMSEMGTYPVYGEIDEETLWFAVSPDGVMEIWWYATHQEDGSIAGALDMQGNQVPFTATRVKVKK